VFSNDFIEFAVIGAVFVFAFLGYRERTRGYTTSFGLALLVVPALLFGSASLWCFIIGNHNGGAVLALLSAYFLIQLVRRQRRLKTR
jgi:hypothetical protein